MLPALKLLKRQRLCKEISLHAAHIILSDNITHFRCFDTFNTDRRTEYASDVHEVFKQLSFRLVFFYPAHKAAVYLDNVKTKILHQTDGGEARSEIVKRYLDSPASEVDYHVFEQSHIQQSASLGYFKAEILWRIIGFPENSEYHVYKIRSFQLRIGQVYIHHELPVLFPYLFRSCDRRFKYPLSEAEKQRVCFNHRDKAVRRNDTVLVIFPPQKRFAADKLLSISIDDRLIKQKKALEILRDRGTDSMQLLYALSAVIAFAVDKLNYLSVFLELGLAVRIVEAGIDRLGVDIEVVYLDNT